MWYLIIPPIIVVVCLSFVLWYLSRKGADPLIAEKASQLGGEAQEEISFLRTQNFFLRILEKTAYRFKVVSLRMHNGFNNLTQALKNRRRRFQAGVLVKESKESSAHVGASKEEQAVAHEGFWHRFREQKGNGVAGKEQERKEPVSMEASSDEALLEKPILRRPKPVEIVEESQPAHVSHETVSSQPTPSFRPMVSETMAHPETVSEGAQEDISREENLIARIAVNPKDFIAYEGLGDHYLESGNVKDAKECYRQVLKLSPLHRIVKIKIRRLENILSQKA